MLVYKHTITDVWNDALKIEKILIGLIDGFRMPLMFILSAMTCRYSTDIKSFKQNTVKAAKHLLLPALYIFLYYVGFYIYKYPGNLTSWQFWKERFFILIFYSAMNSPYAYAAGASWFFVALFVARVLFDILQLTVSKKLLAVVIGILCCIGVALGKGDIYVFSFDVALVVLPFIYAGYLWKKYKPIQLSTKQAIFIYVGLAIFWGIFAYASCTNSFNLADRRYPLFPLCIFVEIAGAILVMLLAKLLEKAKIFLPIQFLGKYCIYFYIAHCLDSTWQEWYQITNNNFIIFLTRVAIDLAFFLVLVGIHIATKKVVAKIKAGQKQLPSKKEQA